MQHYIIKPLIAILSRSGTGQMYRSNFRSENSSFTRPTCGHKFIITLISKFASCRIKTSCFLITIIGIGTNNKMVGTKSYLMPSLQCTKNTTDITISYPTVFTTFALNITDSLIYSLTKSLLIVN